MRLLLPALQLYIDCQGMVFCPLLHSSRHCPLQAVSNGFSHHKSCSMQVKPDVQRQGSGRVALYCIARTFAIVPKSKIGIAAKPSVIPLSMACKASSRHVLRLTSSSAPRCQTTCRSEDAAHIQAIRLWWRGFNVLCKAC